jgi:CheY-like chemotaxis protein
MHTILVVEDDQYYQKILSTKLSNEGYHVLLAENGEKGLETALREHPDLILLDIKMPIMDGTTVMSKLREDEWGKGVPIIMLTNMDPDDKILSASAYGKPVYYLTKIDTPIEDLVTKIKETLNLFSD